MPSEPSNAGIVTDESGSRHIPESTRADGSTRKAIKIRPGYRPPEDVEIYKNRTAEGFRNRAMGPVPGSEGLKDDKPAQPSSASAAKNAKRRERAKAKAADKAAEKDDKPSAAPAPKVEEVNPEVEKEKKVRNLKKKLRQAKELQEKKEGGGKLLPEQLTKVIKINELIRELEALGFDSNGEPKEAKPGEDATKTETSST
ncbi:hypothetical protein QBC42DRAFT_71156 [Cladorrhinum samala]|uniref:WIBG Mago-binding domain-containing protein n=1 Tax=Cladorrhinum samala TaxID=585594 RepID=A0AAV9HSQ1_9PEZI|nr:hypothetical protein QBC42DRAFT_71156 [Cladorrhinum samala]